jgi:hypothetical protein
VQATGQPAFRVWASALTILPKVVDAQMVTRGADGRWTDWCTRADVINAPRGRYEAVAAAVRGRPRTSNGCRIPRSCRTART